MRDKRRADANAIDRGALESPSSPGSIFHTLDSCWTSKGSGLHRILAGILPMLLFAASADAITIDFSVGTVGDLGASSVPLSGIVVDGFYFDGSSWEPANLFRRDDPDDHGLGICNPEETCRSTTSEGDINELDNAEQDELIRLTLPAGFFWTSVGISSMDDNDGDDDEVERGRAFATNDDDPANLGLGTPFWTFAGDGPVELVNPVSGADQLAKYIFFEPIDWEDGTNDNNDFLVWQASIEPVPEPGTLGLLAGGLLGLVFVARRRAS